MSVVVLAGPPDCVGALRRCILGHAQLKSGASINQLDLPSALASKDSPDTFRIETKYFDADLQLVSLTLQNDQPCDLTDPRISSAEGLILILNSLDLEAKNLAELADIEGFSLKVVVHLSQQGSEASQETISQWVLWGLDHGCEFIDVDLEASNIGWDTREKDGFPRLIETIESNMWSNIQKKQPPKPPSGPVAGKNPAPPAPPAPPAAEQTEAEQSDATIRAFQSEMTQLIDGDDEMLNEFSQLLNQAKQVRDLSASGSLPDEERRARAERVALKLSKLMEFLGEGDDDDEDDSDLDI